MAATSNNKNLNLKKPNISFTLPISCQICLGKVKQPVICPNQHVFCTPCLDVWLQHNQLCPTCRVPITPESPCKKIRGGSISVEDKSDQKFGRALRRARVDVIFDEYESEIQKLQDEIKMLRSQEKEQGLLAKYSVQTTNSKEDNRKTENMPSCSSEGSREQVIQQLTMKLKAATTASENIKWEMDGLKEANAKLRDENISLAVENGRLKQSIAARSPRKYEKYAQAALQRRIDQAEKEIGQLKKALTRSDSYIEEQEAKLKVYQERFGDVELDASTFKETNIPQSNLPNGEFTQFKPCLACNEGDLEHTPGNEEGGRKGIFDRGNLHQIDNEFNQRGTFFSFTSSDQNGLGITGSGDGPSPAKRRLYMKDDECTTKERVPKNCRYLPGEVSMNSSPHMNISKSAERPNSDEFSSCLSLGRPSPAELTSFGKMQIDKMCYSSKVEEFRLKPRSSTDDKEKSCKAKVGSGPRRVPRSLSFTLDDEDESSQVVNSDMENERCLSKSVKGCFEESSDLGLNRDDIDHRLDNTLSNLDFTLTPEFVDCTKLLKAAEVRVNGKQPDRGSTSAGNIS